MSEELQPSAPAEPTGEVSPPIAAVPPMAPGRDEIQWADEPAAPEPPAPAVPAAPAAPAAAPVAEAVPEVAPTPASDFTPTQLQNGTWELRTPTGNVYKGASELEAYRNAAVEAVKGKTEADRVIQQLRAQPTPKPTLPEPSQQESQVDPVSVALFDLLVPALEQKYGKGFVDRLAQIDTTANQTAQFVREQQEANAALGFIKTATDYVATTNNAAKVDAALAELSEMAGHDIPYTTENLLRAHALVKGRGEYETVRPEQIAQPEVPRTANGQFAPRNNVMPMPPPPAAPTQASQPVDPFAMSDEQWAAYARTLKSA